VYFPKFSFAQRWVFSWLHAVSATLLLLAVPGLAVAAGNSVAAVVTVEWSSAYQDLSHSAEWCTTSLDETLSSVLTKDCLWRPLDENGGFRGSVADRAHWVRMRFFNPADVEIARELVILPLLVDRVTFFVWRHGNWLPVHSGLSTPMDRRDPAVRGENAVRIVLPPGSITAVYVQLLSDGMLRVQPQLWRPSARERVLERSNLVSASLSGGMVVAILFAVLMFFVSRQLEYVSFAVAVSGELVAYLLRSGLLQRFLWPSSQPIPDSFSIIAAAASAIGAITFFHILLPGLNRQRGWYQPVVATLVAGALLGYVLALVFEYEVGLLLWHVATFTLALILAQQASAEWRRGSAFSACLFVAAVVFLFGVMLRFLVHRGDLTVALWEFGFYPLLATLVVVMLMLALVERTASINRQLASAESRNTAQLDFLAKMSHELRAPLDSVLGNAQLLIRQEKKGEKNGLQAILDSGRHLLRMIDDILDYARGVSGAIQVCPEPLEMKDFLRVIEVGGKLFAVRNRNQFVVRFHDESMSNKPLWLQADAGRLRAVLDNLLINASRHTINGWIFLDCTVARAGASDYRVEFSVKDTGEGIRAEDLQRIFEPFERAVHPTSHGRADERIGKGAGIGLAISRQLVELMGGRLEVASAPGQGATFRFALTLPSVDAPANVRGSKAVDSPAHGSYVGPRRRILVVDDTADSLVVLEALLRMAGFEVVAARGGTEAARELDAGLQVDLVVVDQFMDDGGGWALLDTLERIAPDVPRILISAAPPMREEKTGGEPRFSAFFMKPIDHDRLLQCIGELLSLRWLAPDEVGDNRDDLSAPELSDEDKRALARWVTLGAVTHIRRWASDFRRRRPDCASFAAAVDEAAVELDFARLKRLAGMAPADASGP
jgi:signal transduction histidine kinase/CheY-like chemotaxis protein